ncbi:MAG TPA: hypothetical protein VFG87_05885, partial [Amycolatopsis sp.]|nr:hypothetical protein [Amycolatopsis sp.]
MSIELPGGLAEVFSLLSGQKWPEGDEDKMSAMGDGLVGVGQQFSDVSGNFSAAAGAVLANVGGAPGNQFYDFAAQLQNSLPSMSQGAIDLGTMSRNMATQIEYAKYMIIATLAWLAYEIAQWAAFLPEAVPMFVEAADLAVAAILRRLLTAAVVGGVSMAGMDLAIQGIQKLKGDRSSIDWSTTLGSFESGVLGGALGGAVFTLGSKAIGAVAKSALSDTSVVKKLIDSADDPAKLESVTSGLSASDKIGLGLVSTTEKVGLGATNGVTMGGTMTAAFGGPDNVGLSMASGAAGMLTGERRGSAGADGGVPEPPSDLNLSGVDSAAAKLTTQTPVPTEVTGIDPGTPSANSDTAAGTSVSTTESGGLAGLTTTLVGEGRPQAGGTATGESAAPTTAGGPGSGASGSPGGSARATGGGATTEPGAGTGDNPVAATATGTAGQRSTAGGAAPVGTGRDGGVTSAGGSQTSSGGGTTGAGHLTTGDGSGETGTSAYGTVVPVAGTGTHEGPPASTETGAGGNVGAGGAPRDVTASPTGTGQAQAATVAGGARSAPSATTEAGGGPTAPTDGAPVGGGRAVPVEGGTGETVSAGGAPIGGSPTESSGPVPSVTGVSRGGDAAAVGATPETAAGANPAAASAGSSAVSGGSAVHPPAETTSGGATVSRPVTESQPPTSTSAGARGPQSVVPGGSRLAQPTGPPVPDAQRVDRSATGRDSITESTAEGTMAAAGGEPSGSGGAVYRQAPPDGVTTVTGPAAGSRDLVGQAPEGRPTGSGSGRPVNEESGTGRTPHAAVESGNGEAPDSALESAGPDPMATPSARPEPPPRPTPAAGPEPSARPTSDRPSRTEPASDTGRTPDPRDPAPTDPPRPGPMESTGPGTRQDHAGQPSGDTGRPTHHGASPLAPRTSDRAAGAGRADDTAPAGTPHQPDGSASVAARAVSHVPAESVVRDGSTTFKHNLADSKITFLGDHVTLGPGLGTVAHPGADRPLGFVAVVPATAGDSIHDIIASYQHAVTEPQGRFALVIGVNGHQGAELDLVAGMDHLPSGEGLPFPVVVTRFTWSHPLVDKGTMAASDQRAVPYGVIREVLTRHP